MAIRWRQKGGYSYVHQIPDVFGVNYTKCGKKIPAGAEHGDWPLTCGECHRLVHRGYKIVSVKTRVAQHHITEEVVRDAIAEFKAGGGKIEKIKDQVAPRCDKIHPDRF